MKTIITTLAAICMLATAALPAAAAEIDYGPYAKFLEDYTKADAVIDGVRLTAVDYRRATMNAHDISDSYAHSLAMFMMADPASLRTREEKVAFWINAYNMAAIKMIIDYYPVDSIRSTKISLFTLPWKKEVLSVDGRRYSLHEIEHEILLGELQEPLAHFGVVCASVSCADLNTVPYTPDKVYGQLDAAARSFVNDTKKGVRIDRNNKVVYVSKIFDWGSDDFEKLGGVREVIAKYLVDPNDAEYVRNGGYDLEYMEYDWSTNDLKSAE